MTLILEDTTIENALKTFEGFYLKNDYPNAILALEKSQAEIDPSLYHYNLGTAYGQMKNWPMARFHFLLAEKSGLHSEALSQNLDLAEQTLDVSRLEKPISSTDYVIKTSLIASQGPLISLSLIFLVIGIWLLKKNATAKKAILFLMIVMAPLLLNLWINSWTQKIALSSKTIYDGPAALFGTRGELPAGILILTNTKDDWDEIVYPDRYSGWIKSDGLQNLELK